MPKIPTTHMMLMNIFRRIKDSHLSTVQWGRPKLFRVHNTGFKSVRKRIFAAICIKIRITISIRNPRLIMSSSQGSTYLAAELQVPEDNSLAFQAQMGYMSEMTKPPGINNLLEWGQILAPSGKHPGKSFAQIYVEDPNYVFQMKNRKGVSPWVKSFQQYCRARIDAEHQERMKTMQMPIKPQQKAQSQQVPSSVENEWIQVGHQQSSDKNTKKKTENKRPVEDPKTAMSVDQDSEKIQELQTKIAILQRELDHQRSSDVKSQGSMNPNEQA